MALHFVGFTHPNIRAASASRWRWPLSVKQQVEIAAYARAVAAFGEPDFIHQRWDVRAYQEADVPGDVVVIAQGTAVDFPFTHDDSAEQ